MKSKKKSSLRVILCSGSHCSMERQTIRQTSETARSNALTSLEVTNLRLARSQVRLATRSLQIATVILFHFSRLPNPPPHSQVVATAAVARAFVRRRRARAAVHAITDRQPSGPIQRTFPYPSDCNWNLFRSANVYNSTRFRPDELQRIFNAVGFPDIVRHDGRTFPGVWCFFIGLAKLSTGLTGLTLATLFGLCDTDVSAAHWYFILNLYDYFAVAITMPGALVMLQPYIATSIAAYEGLALEKFGINLGAAGVGGYGGVMDCCPHETAGPGGGPIHGSTARRDPDGDLQRAFFNSWKNNMGLKTLLAVVCGLPIIHSPVSIRTSDLAVLDASPLGAELTYLSNTLNRDLYLFADGIFIDRSGAHFRCPFRCGPADGLNAAQLNHRHAMIVLNQVRGYLRKTAEFPFAEFQGAFKYLANGKRIHLMAGEAGRPNKQYVVAWAFQGIKACMRGNQATAYLRIPSSDLPTAEQYIRGLHALAQS